MHRGQQLDVSEFPILDHLGRAILDVRVLLQVVAFVAGVAALRVWGPIEVQVKIDSLTHGPLVRTGAAFSNAWEHAAGLARTVEQTIGWHSEADPSQSAPDTF